MVLRPMTGTSKRMSWLGLATLTTVSERSRVEASEPLASLVARERMSSPARRMVLSVPSMASTATHAPASITTVCPRSKAAMPLATVRP